jgi:hypothetical protein
MGVVYKARQTALNREVALKVIVAGEHASPAQLVRFLQEAETIAAVSHPGVVQVHEFGTWNEQPFIVMEFCPGGTLASKLDGTPDPPKQAAFLVEQLARAVAAAHSKGIVHRDIKPGNVLLTADGSPKVADFGLAKLTESGQGMTASGAILGTPSYMAPEQARGDNKNVGPKSDVYALGAVLYECLTGRSPFRGSNQHETILQVLNQEPVSIRSLNPVVPTDLETICLKCLQKVPAHRYASASDLADDLDRFLKGRPVTARRIGPLGRARRWVTRNPLVASLLAAVILSLAAGTAASYLSYREADRERQNAQYEANAKEKALGQLQLNVEALNRLSGEQQQTLQHLETEKTSTQTAFLHGVLRPLPGMRTVKTVPWYDAEFVGPLEFCAFQDLALVPEDQFRFRILETGLATRGGTTRLIAWREELVLATVGLNTHSIRTFRTVLKTQLSSTTGSEERLACALWASELPPGDSALDVVAASILFDRITSESGRDTPKKVTDCLAQLAGRLDAERAGTLAKTLVDRIIEQGQLSNFNERDALLALCKRLNPAEARPLAKLVVDNISDTSPSLSPVLMPPLCCLLDRLDKQEAWGIGRLVANRIARQSTTEADSEKLIQSASCLHRIGSSLAPEDSAAVAKPAAKTVTDRLVAIKPPKPGEGLALADLARFTDSHELSSILSKLAAYLSAAEARSLLQTLADVIVSDKEGLDYSIWEKALLALLARLGEEDAVSISRLPADTLAKRFLNKDDFQAIPPVYIQMLAVWAKGLGAEVSERLLIGIAERGDLDGQPVVADSLAVLAQHLSPKEAGRIADVIVSGIVITVEQNDKSHQELSYLDVKRCKGPLLAIATRLPPNEVRRLAEHVASLLPVGLKHCQETHRPVQGIGLSYPAKGWQCASELGGILAELAGGLNPTEAAVVVRQTAKTLSTQIERNPVSAASCSVSLSALVWRLPDAEAAEIVRPVVKALTDRMAIAESPDEFMIASAGVATLAWRLDESELMSLLKSHGTILPIRKAILAEFGRRSCRTQAPSWAVGGAVAFFSPSPAFNDVWEFVDWAEKNRPDLDLKSRPNKWLGKP